MVGFQLKRSARSERANVLGARPFWTIAFNVGDAHSLLQFIEGNSLNIGHMKENVIALRRLDEAKAFIRDAFDGSFRHASSLFR